MAGGLFKGAPFQLNIKCVIFAALLMIAFAMAPIHDTRILLCIPLLSGLIMFAYHNLYRCDQPSWTNWKWIAMLIVTSLGAMAVYWFSPERTRTEWIMYFFIFVYGYVWLAFYDYLFECREPLKEGWLSLTSIFKPEKAQANALLSG